MKEITKKIYSILGIVFLISAITVMAVWISKQIVLNWEFFTFNQRKCMAEYLNSKYETVERMSDEEIEKASQIWNLDKTELQRIKQEGEVSYAEFRAEWNKCYEKYAKKETITIQGRPRYIPLSEQPEELVKCIGQLPSPSHTPFSNFIEGKNPTITDSLIKELRSEGVCVRPPFLTLK